MNKRIKFALLAALLTGAMAPAVSFAQTGTGKVVAVVAGDPISQSEVDERVKINREVAKRAGQKVTDAQLTEYSRDELINERLLLNKAKNDRVTVPQGKVDAALNNMAQGNRMTLEQFQQHVNKVGGAGAWDNLVSDLRNELMIGEMMDKQVNSKVKQPTAKEVDDEIARVSAIADGPMSPQEVAVTQHIYIQGTNAAALKKTKAIKARLDKGEDFAAVAREVSDNKETAQNGGAVPYVFLKDQSADPAVIKAVSNITPNAISEPVKTQNGYHIFKVAQRTTIAPSDEEKKAWAKDALLAQRQKEALAAFYKEMDDSKAKLVEIKK